MRRLAALFVFAVLALSPVRAWAYLAPSFSPSELIAKSEVVAVGTITRVGDLARIETKEVYGIRSPTPMSLVKRRATLRVLLDIKGTQPGDEVAFCYLTPAPPRPGLGIGIGIRPDDYTPGERRLVFLTQGKDSLEPTDPLGRNELGRLPARLALPSLKGTPTGRYEQVLVWCIRSDSDNLRLQCLLLLRDGTTPWAQPMGQPGKPCAKFADSETTKALAALLTDPDVEIRRRVSRALCATNYAPAIPVAVQCYRVAAREGTGLAGPMALESLRTSDCLPYLYPLLKDPDSNIRREAAYALREIRARDSLGHLVEALDDEDGDVRYFAATALAGITGQWSRFLAKDLFAAQEDEQIAYWKAWWGAQ